MALDFMRRHFRRAVPIAASGVLLASMLLAPHAARAQSQDPTPIPPSPPPLVPTPRPDAPDDTEPRPGDPAARPDDPAARPGDPTARPGDPTARRGERAPVVPISTWVFSLGLSGGYESNVDFFASEDVSGDYLGSASASIGHSRRSARGQFNFSVYGGGFRYRNTSDRDRVDLSGYLGGSYQASPRVTFSYSGYGSYVPADRSRVLIISGVQLPPDQTIGYGGTLGMEAHTGEKTTFSMRGGYDRVNFESEEFVDTASAHAGFRFGRKLSPRSDLYLFYDFLRTEDAQADSDNHQAALGWSHLVGRALTFSVASGAGFSRQPRTPDSSGERWYYYGTAGIDGRIGRSTIALQGRRSANPAYGIGGNVLSWGAALSLGIPIEKWGNLALSGVNTWSEDPATKTSAYVSQDAGASFSVRVVRHLALVLSYGYRRIDPETTAASQSHWAAVSINYTRPVPDRRER
jgi:hypothetical protein